LTTRRRRSNSRLRRSKADAYNRTRAQAVGGLGLGASLGAKATTFNEDVVVPNAELVIHGTVLTVDESQPTAEALAVAGGRIVAVGSRAEVQPLIGSDTEVLDIGDGCVMSGLIEAHGHPLMEAIALSDRLVDIRSRSAVGGSAVSAAGTRGRPRGACYISRGPAGLRVDLIGQRLTRMATSLRRRNGSVHGGS
jgi:hypothetical protein